MLYMLEADQFVRGSAGDMSDHPWITVSINHNDNDNDNENAVLLTLCIRPLPFTVVRLVEGKYRNVILIRNGGQNCFH